MKKLHTFIMCFALLFCAGYAFAQERILNFDSSMQVHKDGSATVIEIITLNVEHKEIRRGIIRELPRLSSEPIKIISLGMDGQAHPYFIEKTPSSIEVNFGDDNYLKKGIHTYQLTYKIKGVVRFFNNYDEIYWNVTGNDWIFPIEKASFRLALPEGANAIENDISTYTGYKGSKTSHAVKTDTLTFATTQLLKSGEGFTVAIPFEKGLVEKLFTFDWKKYATFFAGLAIFVFITFYYVITWFRVGRDPKDTIVRQLKPPVGVSPALARRLWNRTSDITCFTAALVSLAMKKRLEITEDKNTRKVTLRALDKTISDLPQTEEAVITRLFKNSDTFTISYSSGSNLEACITAVESLSDKQAKPYFVSNIKFIKFPIVLLLLMNVPLLFLSPVLVFVNLHYSVFFSVFVALPKNKIIKIVAFTLLSLFYSMFFVGGISAAADQLLAGIYEACFLLSLWGLAVYVNIIDNVTEEGRHVTNELKGFYRYMSVAEEHRVELSNPADAERIFADYLPYAFAFGMQNKWIKEFESVIGASKIDEISSHAGGANFIRKGVLAGAIAISLPRHASSSSGGGRSSGSRGGGSSGGGSGGGGGRGR